MMSGRVRPGVMRLSFLTQRKAEPGGELGFDIADELIPAHRIQSGTLK